MKVASIHVSNFLGAAAVDVRTDEPVQLFIGRNAAGKSSLRDAIALALTADLGRVPHKKDAAQLIRDGADAAVCEVKDADGDAWRVTISRSGKVIDSQAGRADDETLPFVLDAQRFARLDDTARRGFLFGLMGLQTEGPDIVARLIKRGCTKGRVERIAPLLRSGFDAASKQAKAYATEAKGAWRAVTGENYGSEKAKTWRAAVPAYDAEAGKTLATELQHLDVALESWQQAIGRLGAEAQRRAALQARIPALQQQLERMPRVETKLATDEQQLADWNADLAKTLQAAGAEPRVGVVHRLAVAIARALPAWPGQDHVESGWQEMRDALDAYELEHGPALKAAGGDEKARARLPNVQRSRDLLASAVANDQRDLESLRAVRAELEAVQAELQQDFDAVGLEDARHQANELKDQRAGIVAKLDALKVAKTQADAAEKKTKDAGAHAADVNGWDVIGDALSPDGIPAEILAAALGPINDRLRQAALDTGWQRVEIAADMAIRCAGRAYGLLSESERWRCDAMLAEAIANLSGAQLLVLDRFDVLDPFHRAELLGWLDTLADTGEISSALLFGTLKALPANLPPTIAAHWLEAGVVGQLKEAA